LADAPPTLVRSSCDLPHPRVPVESRQNGESGTVTIRFLVGADGNPGSAEVTHSSGFERLDAAGVKWLLTCRFRPRIKDGARVADWTANSIVFDKPRPPTPHADDTTSCEIPNPSYPIESRRQGESGTVLVRLHIPADGWPDKLQVSKSSGYARLDWAAIDWLMTCRFKPARENGSPVAAWANQAYTFNLRD